MKRFFSKTFGLAGAFLVAAAVSAQNYDTVSFAIADGGATSTGNGFAVSGTNI